MSAMKAKQRSWLAALIAVVGAAGCSSEEVGAQAQPGAAVRQAHGLGIEVPLPAGFSWTEKDDELALGTSDGAAITVRKAPVAPAMAQEFCASAAKRVELGLVTIEEVRQVGGRGVVCSRIERAGPTANWEAHQQPASLVAVFGDGGRLWIATCTPGRASLQDVESIRPACGEVLAGWRSLRGGAP